MKLEIDNMEVDKIKYNDKNTGEEKFIRKQSAYWHKKGTRYPVKISIGLGDLEALPTGVYNVDSEAILGVNRFESLEVNGYVTAEIIKDSPYKSYEDMKAK